MIRILRVYYIAACCMLFLSACNNHSAPSSGAGGFQSLSFDAAVAKAKKHNLMVMMDFGASWCGPCRTMEEQTFSNQEVKDFLHQHVVAIKIDVDSQRELALKYDVSTIPTMVFLNGDGSEIGRMGFATAAEFLSGVQKIKGW